MLNCHGGLSFEQVGWDISKLSQTIETNVTPLVARSRSLQGDTRKGMPPRYDALPLINADQTPRSKGSRQFLLGDLIP